MYIRSQRNLSRMVRSKPNQMIRRKLQTRAMKRKSR